MPIASAISERLQCVALGGASCTVFAITFSLVSMGSGGTRDGLRLVALEACHALVEIPLLPAPDRWLRCARASHDLGRAVTIRSRKNDLGPPDQLAWRVAVRDQGLKFSTVGGAKIKADVRASHAPNIAHQNDIGNLMSGGEH